MALGARDFVAARDAFTYAFDQDPENLDAALSYAVSLRGLGDLAGAEAAYWKVLSVDGDHLGATYNLGILYEDFLFDYGAAGKMYGRYLRGAPDGSTPLFSDVQERLRMVELLMELE